MTQLSGLHLVHLSFLMAWAGLVAAELVIEVASLRIQRLQYAVARYHKLIDAWVEIPLLVGVVASGIALLPGTVLDTALWIKIACGLGAVGANLFCVVIVFRRGNRAETDDSAESLDPLTKLVFRSAAVGVPLALVALYLGGQRVGWW